MSSKTVVADVAVVAVDIDVAMIDVLVVFCCCFFTFAVVAVPDYRPRCCAVLLR